MQVYIYALLEPSTGKVRYIGQSKDMEKRVRDHWYSRNQPAIRKKNPQLAAWLQTLEHYPQYFVFETVEYHLRHEAEHYYTELLRQIPGIDLLNVNSGSHLSPEHRAKLQEAGWAASRGSKHSPEWIAMMRSRTVSPETRAKMSAARRGQPKSPETRAKMSASQKARLARKRAERGQP